MKWYERLAEIGGTLVTAGDWAGRMEARIERLRCEAGIPHWIPESEEREVDDRMREAIVERRGNRTQSEWLREGGPRDQVCERFGLTPEQVAGVLAGVTRRNGNGVLDEPAIRPTSVEPIEDALGITHNPETWPTRVIALGGSHTKPPKMGRKEYEIDDTDKMIVIAVLEHDPESWNTVRHEIALKRRLLGQQLGKLKQLWTQGRLQV
ncbi:hypothetical protein CO174_04515 [Candidatus Uhrbacteria bacterium CG_4_9_14_3_um_filter_50_9]|uniref:Uncharacterized protein n=1 Tax=Candidatus Uhrbacteria bacterium CG_4_9_14_3_um_filter_50_9 TaxID=1975035 RepID=A0A2M7XBG5_9BACT|nr:MAG: hypothetical protein CO174_04515 [Candidatus Uhrbacteria bacterium CG_4_9_14_3_um_filter_50_9]